MSEKLKVGVIDADLLANSRHRFPNLCCMKISAYYKQRKVNSMKKQRIDQKKGQKMYLALDPCDKQKKYDEIAKDSKTYIEYYCRRIHDEKKLSCHNCVFYEDEKCLFEKELIPIFW